MALAAVDVDAAEGTAMEAVTGVDAGRAEGDFPLALAASLLAVVAANDVCLSVLSGGVPLELCACRIDLPALLEFPTSAGADDTRAGITTPFACSPVAAVGVVTAVGVAAAAEAAG